MTREDCEKIGREVGASVYFTQFSDDFSESTAGFQMTGKPGRMVTVCVIPGKQPSIAASTAALDAAARPLIEAIVNKGEV